MAARPLALPEIFTGEGKQIFSDWVDHFDSVATVNDCDPDAKKLWIRARITGRAATAYKRLSADDQGTYAKIVAALKKRFEPECRKEVYHMFAEFLRRRKQHTEDWAALGEDLRTLAEKAYPALQSEAQELLALNQFLSQLPDAQIAAFGVRQRSPATLDAAVAATLELESYLMHSNPNPSIASCNTKPTSVTDDVVAAAGYKSTSSGVEKSLQQLVERMERLENTATNE